VSEKISRVKSRLFWTSSGNRLVAWSPKTGLRFLDESGVTLSRIPIGANVLALTYDAESSRLFVINEDGDFTEHSSERPEGMRRSIERFNLRGDDDRSTLVEAHFSEQGHRLLGLSSLDSLFVWDVAGGDIVREIKYVDGRFSESDFSAAISPDGSLMGVVYRTWPTGTQYGSVGDHGRSLRIYEVEPRSSPGQEGSGDAFLFEDYIGISHDDRARIELALHQNGPRILKVAVDQEWASLYMPGANDKSELDATDLSLTKPAEMLGFSASGHRYAIGMVGRILVVEGNNVLRAELLLKRFNEAVIAAAFSADEERLALMTSSGAVTVINLTEVKWEE
jgi:hypothetical protein